MDFCEQLCLLIPIDKDGITKCGELTREGTLGNLGLDVASESRASSLDGRLAHERGHLWGNDACRSHCNVRECGGWGRRGRETGLGRRTA